MEMETEKFTGDFNLEKLADSFPIFQLVEHSWSDTLKNLAIRLSDRISKNEQRISELTTNY